MLSITDLEERLEKFFSAYTDDLESPELGSKALLSGTVDSFRQVLDHTTMGSRGYNLKTLLAELIRDLITTRYDSDIVHNPKEYSEADIIGHFVSLREQLMHEDAGGDIEIRLRVAARMGQAPLAIWTAEADCTVVEGDTPRACIDEVNHRNGWKEAHKPQVLLEGPTIDNGDDFSA